MENFNYSVAIVDDEKEALYSYSLILKQAGLKDVVLIQDSREIPIILKERTFLFCFLTFQCRIYQVLIC